MRKPIKFRQWQIMAILTVLIGLIPWQSFLSIISAQQADNNSVIMMQSLDETSTTAKWRTTYNSQSAYTGGLYLTLNTGKSDLESFYWINDYGQKEQLTYLNNKTQFDQRIRDYRNYIASKDAYDKNYQSYVTEVAWLEGVLVNASATYNVSAAELEATLASQQAQITANQAEITNLEASNYTLSTYIQAVPVETTQGSTEDGYQDTGQASAQDIIASNAQYEAQIANQQAQIQALQGTNYELELAMASTQQQLTAAYEPVTAAQSALEQYRGNPPKDPYNSALETSWKVILQADSSKEVYQVYIPQDYRAYSYELSVRFPEIHDLIEVTTAVRLNDRTYRAYDQIKAVKPTTTAEPVEEESSEAEATESTEESGQVEEGTEESIEESTEESTEESSEESTEEESEEESSEESSEESEEESSEESEEETTEEVARAYQLHVWNGSEFIGDLEVDRQTALDQGALNELLPRLAGDLLFWQFVPIETAETIQPVAPTEPVEAEEVEATGEEAGEVVETIETFEEVAVVERVDPIDLIPLIPVIADYVTLDDITWTENKFDLQDPRQPFDLSTVITSDGILVPVYASDYAKVDFKNGDGQTVQTIFIRPGGTLPTELIPQGTAGQAERVNSLYSASDSSNDFLYWTDVSNGAVESEDGADNTQGAAFPDYFTLNDITWTDDKENLQDPRQPFDLSTVISSDRTLMPAHAGDYAKVSFKANEDQLVQAIFIRPGLTIPADLIPQSQEPQGDTEAVSAFSTFSAVANTNDFLYWTDEQIDDEIIVVGGDASPVTEEAEALTMVAVMTEADAGTEADSSSGAGPMKQIELVDERDPRRQFDFSQAVASDTELEAVMDQDYHFVKLESQVEEVTLPSLFVKDQVTVTEEILDDIPVENEEYLFKNWSAMPGLYAPFYTVINETDLSGAISHYGDNGNYGEPVTFLEAVN